MTTTTRKPLRVGVRTRLFLVSVLIIAVMGTVVTVLLQGALETLVQDRIEAELHREVALARVAVEAVDPTPDIAAVDLLADRLSPDGKLRVTIIGADGRVLGDSRLSPADVAALDNHADRPEVATATRTDRAALSRRFSESLARDMVYIASPYRAVHSSGTVRMAVDLDAIEDVVRASRLTASGIGLLALIFAVFMSAFAGQLANRSAEAALVRVREALARADRKHHGPAALELSGLAGGVRDLSDRLQEAVGNLAAEKARFGALLDSMSEAVLALDGEARIVLANPAAVDLLGLEGRAEGRLLLEVVRAPALVGLVRRVLGNDGDPISGPDTSHDSDHDQAESVEVHLQGGATVLATARALPDGLSCVLVLHDITEARRVDRIRRDFVANVSHELRTPIAIIRANAESLADGALEDPAVARPFLDAILRSTQRLALLIADLLDLSRIEAGRLELKLEPVDLADAAARALAEVQPQADAAGHELGIDIPAGLAVRADRRAVDHILLNLVENAVKYTPAGGSIRVVAAADEQGGDTVCITVEDDGPGIPESQRPRVFERFYRVDAGRARPQGGTGLGLAIVKHLAEILRGSVGLESRRPHGSAFWVRLPAVKPD